MKRLMLFILILSPIFTTGCWDMQEINERIFPYSVGLDLLDEEDYKGGRYDITFTYLNINALGSQAIQEDLVYLTSVKGNNIFEGAFNIADRLQKPMYLRDLKVVIIPETLGKNKELIKEIVDGQNRDYIINQAINFIVVEGTAKEVLEEKIKSEKQIEIEGLFYGLLKNDQGSGKFIPSALHSFINEMYTSKATLVPVARIEEGNIILDRSAVFKDYELIGYLDEEDNGNISLLTNKIKDFGINAAYEGVNFAVRTARPKTKKILKENGDGLKIKYTVRVNGEVEQFIIGKGKELDDEDKLTNIERALEKNLEESIKKTVEQLQKDLNVDVIGVSDFLYKFHPEVWGEIENNFYDIFPKIDIEIDVKAEIKRRGLTK